MKHITDAYIARDQFTFWFTPHPNGKVDILLDGRMIGYCNTDLPEDIVYCDGCEDAVPESMNEILDRDYQNFIMHRPEMWLRLTGEWLESIIDGANPIDLKAIFKGYVCAVYYSKYDDEKAEKYAERLLAWLEESDFYDAPASTTYHDSEPNGLVRHTLKVIASILDLMNTAKFRNVNAVDAIIVAIVHDFCKIGFYEQYMRNVKNEETGIWEKVPSYRCKGSSIPLGHGVTSMFIAQKFFKLTTEQALAIRWHMGEHSVAENESHDLMDANESYPMVQLIQMADRMAIMA